MSPLETARSLAGTIERACNQTVAGMGRDPYATLRRTIEVQESEHRAFGRRLVGKISPRASVSAATDLFVCRTFADAPKHRTTASLDGVRADYVQAALIWHSPRFREVFARLLAERTSGPRTIRAFRAFAAKLDYCSLVAGDA